MSGNMEDNSMRINSITAVCFSATGTTRTVLQNILSGMDLAPVEIIDITAPQSRRKVLRLEENELLLVAAPVYMGRLPAIVSDWLYTVSAENTPAAGIVVYGNRMYDDALLELCDILQKQGCIPFTGAAFIGEHSFSSPEYLTAAGRPDASDRGLAVDYGREIVNRLLTLQGSESSVTLSVPGNKPYGGATKVWDVDFIAVGEKCTNCGRCAEVCPVEAVSGDNSKVVDIERCITCCACIKYCPVGARTLKPGLVLEASERLHNMYSARREPELFW